MADTYRETCFGPQQCQKAVVNNLLKAAAETMIARVANGVGGEPATERLRQDVLGTFIPYELASTEQAR
jgi:hypothetical protein